MPSRVYHYAEATARTTSTSTDWSAEKVALTFTGNANKKYAIFWSVYADSSDNGLFFHIRCRNTTAGVDLDTLQTIPAVATNTKLSCGGMVIFDAGSSPASTTFAIQGRSESSSATLGMATASILALELTDDDVYVESLAEQAVASTTFATKCTLSWTPPSAGDYLIIASRLQYIDSSGPQASTRLHDGSTAYRTQTFYWYTSSDQNLVLDMVKGTNLSGAQNWSLQHNRVAGSDNCYVANARMLALRLDGFDNWWYDEDLTQRSLSSTTWTDSQTSITATPAAVDHFILACGYARGSNETATSGNRVHAGGAVLDTVNSQITASGDNLAWRQQKLREETAVSTTWKVQYARASGSGTIYSDDSALAVLQLESAVATVTATGSLGAAVQRALSAGLAAGGAVRTTRPAAIAADAAAAALRTVLAQLDSAVRRLEAVAPGADGAIRATRAAGLGAAGAAQARPTGAADLDAALQAARAALGGLDAAILAAASIGLGASAAVRQAMAAAADLDAAVRRLISLGVGADARIIDLAARAVAVECDAAIRAARSAAADLTAAIAVVLQATFGADAGLRAARALALAAAAAVQAPGLAAALADVAAQRTGLALPAADGAVRGQGSAAVGLDARLRAPDQGPAFGPAIILAGAIAAPAELAAERKAFSSLSGDRARASTLAGTIGEDET